MKTFKLGEHEYEALDCISGILIDPVFSKKFWTEPIDERNPEEMSKWHGLPFIVSDANGGFNAYCLTLGSWDRPSLIHAGTDLSALVAILANHNHD